MEHNKLPGASLPRLYLISSGQENPDNGILLEQLTLLPHTLCCMVQIREKQLNAKQLLTLALKARGCALPDGSMLLVNERVDIALAARLDGVHLPESGCYPDKLRPIAPNMIFGCSVHSPESLHIAEKSGADYLLFGPVFDTPSKRKYGAPQGLEKLGQICQSTTLPVFALGGVTPENGALCMAEGAYGIAGLSIFQDTSQFVDTLEQFYRIVSP
ncbi:MAG: thiamine phosphate synthase [Chlorobiaceae bacterium]